MTAIPTYPWAVVLVEARGRWVPLARACSLGGGQALRGQTATVAAAGACAELPSEASCEVL
jgi:hypothetical protein